MTGNIGAPEAGKLPKAWTSGLIERSRQRASGPESVGGQCRMMRSVLGRIRAGAARRILDSRKIRV